MNWKMFWLLGFGISIAIGGRRNTVKVLHLKPDFSRKMFPVSVFISDVLIT